MFAIFFLPMSTLLLGKVITDYTEVCGVWCLVFSHTARVSTP